MSSLSSATWTSRCSLAATSASAIASSSSAATAIQPWSRQAGPAMSAVGHVRSSAAISSPTRSPHALADGDDARGESRAVLGLAEQVGGDQARVGGLVGDDQHLGRAGEQVDADAAEELALGLGDVGVAGADEHVDRREVLDQPEGHRGQRPARRRARRPRRRPRSTSRRASPGGSRPRAGAARSRRRAGRRPPWPRRSS